MFMNFLKAFDFYIQKKSVSIIFTLELDLILALPRTQKNDNKNIILIGARNMSQESVPKKSSFGNKFSNFWFWAETGIKLQDTQSGFRLYPLKELKKLKFYTSKFEFEIEVIVKAAWSGVCVKNVAHNTHSDIVSTSWPTRRNFAHVFDN